MAKTQSSFALSDESKQLLAELAQRLGISKDAVLDLAIRAYARRASVASDPDDSRSDVLLNRRHAALALGVSPHVITQLYAQGRIRGVATSDGEMYSRQDVLRVARELASERAQHTGWDNREGDMDETARDELTVVPGTFETTGPPRVEAECPHCCHNMRHSIQQRVHCNGPCDFPVECESCAQSFRVDPSASSYPEG